jgi:hypothetical protein
MDSSSDDGLIVLLLLLGLENRSEKKLARTVQIRELQMQKQALELYAIQPQYT